VNFVDAIPPHLEEQLEVVTVNRQDTDGDDFKEWVVFYAFDLQEGNNPIKAAIYDSDRGDPPVIFPYQLRPPDRDYVSENSRGVTLDFAPITDDNNGPDGQNLDEILIADRTNLSIFRFRENSEVWDFPRDSPPRYEVIGHFRGNGGVNFNPETLNVSVVDRNGFERSQLSIRSIYTLNSTTNTYWDNFVSETLAAPIVSTIDFYQTPPTDILGTEFPEKIVLAFYAASCNSTDSTLCRNTELIDWDPTSFLAEDAAAEYANRNWAYFGLPDRNIQSISVSLLQYYPRIEVESSQRLVTGPQPQLNVVDIAFIANGSPIETARFAMRLVDGQWKIARRVEADTLTLDSSSSIQLSTE
jgi:hypothetical protein